MAAEENDPGALSFDDLLASRERRARRQAALLRRHEASLVCLTIVMPGPVKNNPWTRRSLGEGAACLDELCEHRNWPVLARERYSPPSGPEAYQVIDADPAVLKRAAVELEEASPIGRLWDLDVFSPGMKALSRSAFGLPPRRCLVCSRPARECARAQRHPLDLLLATIGTLMEGHHDSAC